MTNKDIWGFPEEKKVSDYFNFKAGETKLRVLTQPIGVRQYFKDGQYVMVDNDYDGPEQASTKGWSWCSIRPNNEIKVVKFPYSIIKGIQAFMTDEEYAFEGFPMPYDLTITAEGEGLERRYKVLASRKNTEVTKEELEALEEKTPISEIVEKIKNKGTKVEYPEAPEDEVPF